MVANIYDFIETILPHIEAKPRNSWVQRVKCFREKYPLPSYENILHPANIIPFVDITNLPLNVLFGSYHLVHGDTILNFLNTI